VDAGGARAAEEVHVAPVGLDAPLLLGAVPDAEVHLPVLSLGDGDTRRNLRGFCPFGTHRFDVCELEDFERIKIPLALEEFALPEQLAGVERELASDDAVVHAGVALDLNRPVVRDRAGLRLQRNGALARRASGRLRHAHRSVRVSVIFQFVERRFTARLQQRAIDGLPGLEWKLRLEISTVILR
jgi:hypothetical protein